jgi:hypothetical protein
MKRNMNRADACLAIDDLSRPLAHVKAPVLRPGLQGSGPHRNSAARLLLFALGRPVSPDHEAVRRNDLREVKSSKPTAARLLGSHF